MRVTDTTSRTVRTYLLTIEDGEMREQPYSRQGRMYRVARIEVTKRDGNVAGVKLGGPVIKKDGTDSLNWADETFYGTRDWPTWLHEIAKGLA